MIRFLKTIAGHTAIYGLGTAFARLLNYLLVPFYTRWFLPEQYGIVVELYAYAGFLFVILTHGMESGFLRFAGKRLSSLDSAFSTAFSSVLGSSATLLMTVFLFKDQIGSLTGYSDKYHFIIMLSFILILDSLGALGFAYLRLEGKALKYAIIRLFSVGITVVLNFLFFLFVVSSGLSIVEGWFVEYVFVANFVGSFLALVLAIPWRLLTTPSLELWKNMAKFAFPLMIMGIIGMINEVGDRLMLKWWYVGSETEKMHAVGVYGAVYKLAMLLTLFLQAFRYAIEPFYYRISGRQDHKQIMSFFFNVFLVASMTLVLTVILFIDWFKLIIDERYHEGLVVVPILAFANLALGLYFLASFWYRLTGESMWGVRFSLIGAIITVVVNYWGIPKWGYVASAVATLLAYSSMFIMALVIGQKKYPVPYNWKTIILIFLFGLITLLLFYVARMFMHEDVVWISFVLITVFLIITLPIAGLKLKHIRDVLGFNTGVADSDGA
ncbi:MAG: oligosaccharide flippase family protein [Chlorobi bacterium]|nr:oligosaccharide flippase family protein [Chlorobiota bacterium]